MSIESHFKTALDKAKNHGVSIDSDKTYTFMSRNKKHAYQWSKDGKNAILANARHSSWSVHGGGNIVNEIVIDCEEEAMSILKQSFTEEGFRVKNDSKENDHITVVLR